MVAEAPVMMAKRVIENAPTDKLAAYGKKEKKRMMASATIVTL